MHTHIQNSPSAYMLGLTQATCSGHCTHSPVMGHIPTDVSLLQRLQAERTTVRALDPRAASLEQ